MEWQGRRSSSNVDDARGSRTMGGFSAGAGMLLSLVGRRFGIKGILVMIVLGVILWQAGLIDPNQLTCGPRAEGESHLRQGPATPRVVRRRGGP